MKKFFMALMAVAAIAFTGCKPQNEPDKDKEQKDTAAICTSIQISYDVEFTGKASDYVKLDIRYVEIPDTNKIAVKQNITESWKYSEFTVTKGTTACYGIEYSLRATELFKQALTDEAKYNTMLKSGSKFSVALTEVANSTNGYTTDIAASNLHIDFSEYPAFDASKADELKASLEKRGGWANKVTWNNDGVLSSYIDSFWNRH